MKSRSKNNSWIILLATLAAVNLLVLLILKYYLNGLSLLEFRIDYIGNVLNLVITFLFLVGLGTCVIRKKNPDVKKVSLLLSFQMIVTISLVFIFAVEKLNIINLTGYLFSFPIKKVYVGFLFILGELIQIYSMVYLWGLVFNPESLLGVRSIVRTAAAVAILMIFSLLYVWNVKIYSEEKLPSAVFEYACVPGAAVWGRGKPSPILEGRIRKALDLYRKNRIKKIILTGGHAPGEISESEAAYKYLSNLEVPKEVMILETQSTTTTDQIKFLRNNFYEQQKIQPILMISDGFHLSRVTQISKFFKVSTLGVASDHSPSFSKTLFYRARESVGLLLFWLFAI